MLPACLCFIYMRNRLLCTLEYLEEDGHLNSFQMGPAERDWCLYFSIWDSLRENFIDPAWVHVNLPPTRTTFVLELPCTNRVTEANTLREEKQLILYPSKFLAEPLHGKKKKKINCKKQNKKLKNMYTLVYNHKN